MKEILNRAFGGEKEAVEKAAQAIASLPRSEDGVFRTDAIDENIYGAGILVYPVYADCDTRFGKKAGYMDIAAQMTALYGRLLREYTLMSAACFCKTLADTLYVMSPEIYEHYRSIQDILRDTVRLVVEKEGLGMTSFPESRLKVEVNGKDKAALKLFGMTLLEAAGKGLLLSEKYEPLGKALAALS